MTEAAAAVSTPRRRIPTPSRPPATKMNPNDLTRTLSLYSVTIWHSKLHLVPPRTTRSKVGNPRRTVSLRKDRKKTW